MADAFADAADRAQAAQAAASDDQEIGSNGRGEERRDRRTVVTLAFNLYELIERCERGVVRRYDTNSGVEPLGEITGDAECARARWSISVAASPNASPIPR